VDRNIRLVVELVVFVLILLALNYFFNMHIYVLGSVILTLVIVFFFRFFRTKT
jgi:hypothetical protein